MKLYNLKVQYEQVSFTQAVQQGLGQQQGLFFPLVIPVLNDIEQLLKLDFITRSSHLLSTLIGDEIPAAVITNFVQQAFTFPVPLVQIESDIAALELFHGPTLAFKDFGGRFMAQVLHYLSTEQLITILTATSGDTGAAVAHAFYNVPNIQVVILYPEGKISPLQEALFCTLGNNIHTVAIQGDFDVCQALVKQAFDDHQLKQTIGLNSANSINISRLVAQVCYYFEAVAQLTPLQRKQIVISVPSGNFGNLTAGLIAKAMGLPIKRFIAATNSNDTVPRYLATGHWQPHETITTLANAMDVSQPNNWPRIEALFSRQNEPLANLCSVAVNDETTRNTLRNLASLGYLSEPHGAIAYRALRDNLQIAEHGLFLGTAHPAKFKESVEAILERPLAIPTALSERADLPILSHRMDADFTQLKVLLTSL